MTAKPPALDPATLTPRKGSGYPAPFDAAVKDREKRALGDPLGLTHFGVNLVTLPPGAASSQRHWHTQEDEFVYILKGALTLVTDGGEQTLTAGMAAGFPAGKADGHHLINLSAEPAVYLEVGDRVEGDCCHYPDIDLYMPGGTSRQFLHKNGEPY